MIKLIDKCLLGFTLITLMFSLIYFKHHSKEVIKPKPGINLYLYGDIEESDNIDHILTVLKTKHHQNISLYIDSLGGEVGLEHKLMKAIKTTDNNLQIIVKHDAASAAGMIAMIRPEILKFHKYSRFMVHFVVDNNYDFIDFRNDDSVGYDDFNTLAVFHGLLTQKEIKNIRNGGIVVIYGSEMSQRLCSIKHLCNNLIKE